MYRHASRLLIRSSSSSASGGRAGGGGGGARAAFSTDVPAPATEDTGFVEAWRKVAPSLEPPKTPSAFMKPRPPTPSSIPSKLTVNFVLPYQSEISNKEVDMVIIPATTGQMGVLPGHVATIAELKPGLLSVHEGMSLVQKGLADFTQKLNSATTDLEKAEAQIGVDVHSALNAALTG
uniref:ATP synthase F1 complex delta/epsilon subunit N-terminal domain-containing protein n=1 Tax=Ananas comosus var. bracteatus TaxID=296719 RepID=A0A6V7QF43_ANACO|nr:unnamed protein product [Ananas comosus var. bracteatus]